MADTRRPYSKPDQQGKFDGLCGLYSILNTIKWLYHMTGTNSMQCFEAYMKVFPTNSPKLYGTGSVCPKSGAC